MTVKKKKKFFLFHQFIINRTRFVFRMCACCNKANKTSKQKKNRIPMGNVHIIRMFNFAAVCLLWLIINLISKLKILNETNNKIWFLFFNNFFFIEKISFKFNFKFRIMPLKINDVLEWWIGF